ncbi:MAG: deoxyribonuclease IV [Desulfobacterales bacterium]
MTKPHDTPGPLLGAHFSIAGGLERALYTAAEYGCTAAQLFTKNANTWKEREVTGEQVERFCEAARETGIQEIAAHTSYLINLAAPDKEKHKKSCAALSRELDRASKLSIPYVVLHPGAHMGAGEKAGLARIIDSINRILASAPGLNTRLLVETTAGQGSGIGHRFEQIAEIIGKAESRGRIGVCLDTCHVFAAGYDIRTATAVSKTLSTFDRIIGLQHLFLVHLNDAKKGLGSRVDRHEHIGRGMIGKGAFRALMAEPRLAKVAKIIETPKKEGGKDWDRVNLALLRSFVERK